MRWLWASEQFKKFALTDGALDELKYWLWSRRALIKHYENERYCDKCNKAWCGKRFDLSIFEKKYNLTQITRKEHDEIEYREYIKRYLEDECIKLNHKHWEENV